MAGGYTKSEDEKALSINIGTVASNAVDTFAFAIMPFDGEVTAFQVSNSVTVAKHTADYRSVLLLNGSSTGGATTTMATLSGEGASGNVFAANVPSAATLSTTTANRRFAAGDILVVNVTGAGTEPEVTAPCMATVWFRAGYEHGAE